jgi:hypothetical protein
MFLVVKLDKKDFMEDLGMGMIIKMEFILKKWGGGYELSLSHFR